MPILTKSDSSLFPDIVAWPLVNMGNVCHVNATERLAAFVGEQAQATRNEWVQLEDGTYDLHPDIRWCPSDAPPSE